MTYIKLFSYGDLAVEVVNQPFGPSEDIKDYGRAFSIWLEEEAPGSFYDGIVEYLEERGYIKEVSGSEPI